MKRIIALFLCVILSLGLFGCSSGSSRAEKIFSTTEKIEDIIAMSGDNININVPMMNYFYSDYYDNHLDEMVEMGLNAQKDVHTQYTSSGQCWYDYIMEMTEIEARQILIFCEAAMEEGFEYDSGDEINEDVRNLKLAAEEKDLSYEGYLTTYFGEGVTEDVYRRCRELTYTAEAYEDHLKDSYDISDEEILAYYEGNLDRFNQVDYLVYTFDIDNYYIGEDDALYTEQLYKSEMETAADELAATTSADAFLMKLGTYLRTELYYGLPEAEKTSFSADAVLANCRKTCISGVSSSSISEWLFNTERVPYDIAIMKSDDGSEITVAMILPCESSNIGDDCLYRKEYNLKTIRYVPFRTEMYESSEVAYEAAEAAYGIYLESPTEETFEEIANYYNYSSYKGGYIENLDRGAISTEADTWLYDSARAYGDVAMFRIPDKGTYIVYYVGEGEVEWKFSVRYHLVSEQFVDDYMEMSEKYDITSHDEGLSMVHRPN